jgi:hypothetical protein
LYSLDKRVSYIMRNSDNPFDTLHLREMMKDAGWNILEEKRLKHVVYLYIPPEKTELHINLSNYRGFVRDQDFFEGEESVVSYFNVSTLSHILLFNNILHSLISV